MAFTKTPMQDTAQTKTVPFLSEWETRNSTNNADVDNLNVVWDLVQDQANGTYFEAIKREGLSAFKTATGIPYGAYYWEFNNMYVLITSFGLEVFSTTAGGGPSFSTALATGDSRVGFTEFLFDNGNVHLVFINNNKAWIYDGVGTVTQITDPDFPTVVQPFPVFLDGYLFVVDGIKGDLLNSDLNVPTSWTASNFISVESYPDKTTALARQGQYIVAFGTQSIQFFYNAANPTGTPLAAQTTVIRVGYDGGLAQTEDSLLFIGAPPNGVPSVYMLKGLKITAIQNNSATRRLLDFTTTTAIPIERYGHVLAWHGHTLYTWVNYNPAATQTNTTIYAVDLTNQLWTRIATAQTSGFPIRTSAIVKNNNRYASIVTFTGEVFAYEFRAANVNDNGTNFTVRFQTFDQDYGTRRTKFGARVLLNCDQTSATSLCNISWSDDDYQTFSTPRPIDLSSKYPVLYALGSFRKRAWRVEYTGAFTMRWQSMELDYDQGTA